MAKVPRRPWHHATRTEVDLGGNMESMRLPNGQDIFQINPAETSLMYRNIVSGRSYLQHGVALHAGSTVFDVGANVGIATLFFHWECPGIRVFAFEPAPELFKVLQANIATHHVNAVACELALSNTDGVRPITYYPDTTVMTGLYADPADDARLTRAFLRNTGFEEADVLDLAAGRHDTEVGSCQLTTLSEVVRSHRIDEIDLLKVNVEKAERDVLDGIDDSTWPKIRQLTVQLHDLDGRLDGVRAELVGRGYRVHVDQDPLLAGTEIYELFAVRNCSEGS
jgi:FkbM family methyltransferase